MTEKERIDACIELAKFSAQRHDARRGYEWKVTLGFWALIVIAIASRPEWPSSVPWWIVPVLNILAGSIYIRGWLYPLWAANEHDKARYFRFRRNAEAILRNQTFHLVLLSEEKLQGQEQETEEKEPGVDASFRRFRRDWSMRFQGGTSIALLFLFQAADAFYRSPN